MEESAQAPPLVVGIDVGGTNTDAVLLRGSKLITFAKVPTTADVSSGVEKVVNKLFGDDTKHNKNVSQVSALFLGTTSLVNALLEGRGLDTVAIVRLCGPSSRSLPPFVDFPPSLKQVICAGTWFASGGLRFDGREECCISDKELERIAATEQMQKANAVVVSCTFSPADDSHEQRAASLLRKALPSSTRVTISSTFGQLGLLARENSAILDASLSRTARRAAVNTRRALRAAGISMSTKLYFTANDGSVISFQKATQSPLRCVACGPTNSLRGAAFLSSSANANNDDFDRIVLDVGGTSTDAGCLVRGKYPRDSNAEAFIAGVRCNHRATDVVSIALGGGSIVSNDGTLIGPESVGADIASKALCFGGNVCTATCIAVAMGSKMTISSSRAPRCDFNVPPYAATTWKIMQKKFYDLVESTRTSNSPIEVIVVGGGAQLVDSEALSDALGGCSVTIPDYAAVANACGSALAQGVGEAEIIADLSPSKREAVLSKLKAKAQAQAGPGAHVIEHEEVKLAYLPGNMTRVFVRAVAPLDLTKRDGTCADLQSEEANSLLVDDTIERYPALRLSDPPPVKPSPPNVKDGVWTLSEYDAQSLAIGCGILGCGGGGSTFHGLLQLLAAIRDGRLIRIVSTKSVPSDSMVAPCGFMGAPSVSLETIGDAKQLLAAVLHNFEVSSVDVGKAFIVSSEIGGSNGLLPLLVGGMLDRPIVDADLMGRAFPELQMTTASIYGLPQTPMTASDSFGRCVTIHSLNESGLLPADALDWTERVLRPVCIEFGCKAGLADNLMTGSELHRVGVLGSLSRARHIGDCVLRSRHPDEAIERILIMNGGRCLFRGTVSDVQRETTAGFAKGHVTIRAEDKLTVMTVEFQNEFLIARIEASGSVQVVGCVPDIISILDIDTARPIATEEIRFGCRVCVLLLPVSAKLRTADALRIVGPSAFGLETSFASPLYPEVRVECDDYQSIAETS